MFQYDPNEALSRRILTYDQIYARAHEGILADPYQSCLLETKEFLKLFAHLHRIKVPRRTLQLYSSPGFKLIPLPVHRGGYKSYYLNPEHTVRLAVVMHLQSKHYFPLKAIQKVMKDFPEEHYRFILQDTLKGAEILESAYLVKEGFDIKDVLYRKVSGVLEDIDEPYWDSVAKFGKRADEEHEKYVDQALLKETHRLAEWLKSGRRHKVAMADTKRTDKERDEAISWLHAIERKGGNKSRV